MVRSWPSSTPATPGAGLLSMQLQPQSPHSVSGSAIATLQKVPNQPVPVRKKRVVPVPVTIKIIFTLKIVVRKNQFCDQNIDK
jgi:hypothetical protein